MYKQADSSMLSPVIMSLLVDSYCTPLYLSPSCLASSCKVITVDPLSFPRSYLLPCPPINNSIAMPILFLDITHWTSNNYSQTRFLLLGHTLHVYHRGPMLADEFHFLWQPTCGNNNHVEKHSLHLYSKIYRLLGLDIIFDEY